MRRRRRKFNEEKVNHERWVVSYADFITLLFAFFVVMYSISSVNEGKYRVLSQTLVDAFQEPKRSQDPIQMGEVSRSRGELAGLNQDNRLIQLEAALDQLELADHADDDNLEATDDELAKDRQRMNFVAAAIEDMLDPYIEKGLVDVTFTDNEVRVNMKDKMLFSSGSARVSGSALQALRYIGKILSTLPNSIEVEGHTDNRPIRTFEFPSNWELSAARAANVVHLLADMGIAPQRLSAVGYGEYQPVTENDSDAGRQKNRRVTLIVKGLERAKPSVELTGDG